MVLFLSRFNKNKREIDDDEYTPATAASNRTRNKREIYNYSINSFSISIKRRKEKIIFVKRFDN